MMTGACWACGAGHDNTQRFCARCGSGVGGARALLALGPAAVAGTVGALLALTASMCVRAPAPPRGIVESLEALALGTTLPHFDVAMGAVAGWAAVSALRFRSIQSVLAAAAATTLLYVAALLAVSQATGRPVVSHEWGWVLLAPSLGAVLAGALAARIGRGTGLGPFLNGFSGARLPLTALFTVLSVAALIVLYGLILAAVAAVLAVLAVVVALRIAAEMFSNKGPQTRRVYVSADGEETERSSRVVKPWGGEEYVEHRDGDDRVVRTEHVREPLFGENFIEHRDADGKIVGSVHQGESFFGGKYLEHRDGEGEVVGTVRRKEPLFGEAYLQEKDAQGNVVAESRRVEPLFGEAYIQEKDAQGNVVAESRRVEPLFGEAYIERKEVKR